MVPYPHALMEKSGVSLHPIGLYDLPDILAFTVTKPMYERLCRLGGNSFLFKPFLAGLRKAREEGSK